MNSRFLYSWSALIAVSVVVLLVPVCAIGQTPDLEPKSWTPAQTPWGDPDLQGTWTNETIPPFERPSELEGRAFLSETEAAELAKQTARQREVSDGISSPGSVGSYNQAWFDSGTKVVSSRQTSLVVTPPNGRVPVRPSAEAKRDYDREHSSDSYIYMSVWDRCITRGVPGSMFPAGYNNAYQILQIPGYVVILYEMIHDVRFIPLDGRSHIDEKINLWMGDSRSHWEENTLVVETTNFTDKGWIATSASQRRIKGIPQTTDLHIIERFTRVDADTIQYEVTIEDPQMYTHPWKVAIPLNRNPDYRMFEYACHEGNTAVDLILGGARAQEVAAQKSQ